MFRSSKSVSMRTVTVVKRDRLIILLFCVGLAFSGVSAGFDTGKPDESFSNLPANDSKSEPQSLQNISFDKPHSFAKGIWTGADKSKSPHLLNDQWNSIKDLVSNRSMDSFPPHVNLDHFHQLLKNVKSKNISFEETVPMNIVVFGGSMTFGSECFTEKEKSKFTIDPRLECAWPGRFQKWLDTRYSKGVFKVHNLGSGMTSTIGMAGDIQQRLNKLNLTNPPDVIIWDYTTNDFSELERFMNDNKIQSGSSVETNAGIPMNLLSGSLEAVIREILNCDSGSHGQEQRPTIILMETSCELMSYHEVAKRYALPLVSFQSVTRPRDLVYDPFAWSSKDHSQLIKSITTSQQIKSLPWSSIVYARGPTFPVNALSKDIKSFTRVHPPGVVHQQVADTLAAAWEQMENAGIYSDGGSNPVETSSSQTSQSRETCPAPLKTLYLKYNTCSKHQDELKSLSFSGGTFNAVECDANTWKLENDVNVGKSAATTARARKRLEGTHKKNTGWVATGNEGGSCSFNLTSSAIHAIRIEYVRTYGKVADELGVVEVKLDGVRQPANLVTQWNSTFSSVEAMRYSDSNHDLLAPESSAKHRLEFRLKPREDKSSRNYAKVLMIEWC